MKRFVLDTNVVIRFLRNDHPVMSPAAAALFRASSTGDVELILEATLVAESVFVLTSFYKESRRDVADALRDLINGCRLKVAERETVLDALARFSSRTIDFPDALAVAIAAREKIPVASFDRDVGKFADVTRFEPTS